MGHRPHACPACSARSRASPAAKATAAESSQPNARPDRRSAPPPLPPAPAANRTSTPRQGVPDGPLQGRPVRPEGRSARQGRAVRPRHRRGALRDQRSTRAPAAITVTSDPLPQSVDGIPLPPESGEGRHQPARIHVQPDQLRNPGGVGARSRASPRDPAKRRRASHSRACPSPPAIARRCPSAPASGRDQLDGITQTRRPAFRVTVTQRPRRSGDPQGRTAAPRSAALEQRNPQQSLHRTAVRGQPRGCPEASVVGTATAHTPLLNVPLTGRRIWSRTATRPSPTSCSCCRAKASTSNSSATRHQKRNPQRRHARDHRTRNSKPCRTPRSARSKPNLPAGRYSLLDRLRQPLRRADGRAHHDRRPERRARRPRTRRSRWPDVPRSRS